MKLKRVDGGAGQAGYAFHCPGCRERHVLFTDQPNGGPVWRFNGDAERPTFTPSLLVTSGCRTRQHQPGDSCWCTFNAELVEKGEEPSTFKCGRCHLFLTDGRLQFLDDCSHDHAGRTVDLPDIPVPAE